MQQTTNNEILQCVPVSNYLGESTQYTTAKIIHKVNKQIPEDVKNHKKKSEGELIKIFQSDRKAYYICKNLIMKRFG
jgi:hypothetical protein